MRNQKRRLESVKNFHAVFEENGDGYTVTVPALPGLVTEGRSLREARAMAKDAITCYLESLLKERRAHRLVRRVAEISVPA